MMLAACSPSLSTSNGIYPVWCFTFGRTGVFLAQHLREHPTTPCSNPANSSATASNNAVFALATMSKRRSLRQVVSRPLQPCARRLPSGLCVVLTSAHAGCGGEMTRKGQLKTYFLPGLNSFRDRPLQHFLEYGRTCSLHPKFQGG